MLCTSDSFCNFRHTGGEVERVEANSSTLLYDGDQIGLSQHDSAKRHCTVRCGTQIVTAGEVHVLCSGELFSVALGLAPVELGRKHVKIEEELLTSRKQAVVRAVFGNVFEILSVGKSPTHVTR